MSDLVKTFGLDSGATGYLTSAVQLGFIFGTLVFALLTIADRFSPSKVFFTCAILGALSNLCITWDGNVYDSILVFRFSTGFFLAGIYPVGMKIAADYFEKGLGKALGFLVGALVLGTAFPHFLKDSLNHISWKSVLYATSLIALLGGIAMLLFVPDGPFRKPSQKLDVKAFLKVFEVKNFRAAAFGYFGHMWELYAFWAFTPVIIEYYKSYHNINSLNTSLLSFIIIGLGGLACVLGGFLASRYSTKKVAFSALSLSCLCCLLSPFFLTNPNEVLFIAFLIFWGLVVIADSPLFSTLVAQNANVKIKGTALTIVNCIGFSITIFSIQLLNYLIEVSTSSSIFMILSIGPILGLTAFYGYKKRPYKV
tara:strand:+ start:21179 stop:22279 length:1101 start_codon:yes stop_codon:yes gene_type:complete